MLLSLVYWEDGVNTVQHLDRAPHALKWCSLVIKSLLQDLTVLGRKGGSRGPLGKASWGWNWGRGGGKPPAIT